MIPSIDLILQQSAQMQAELDELWDTFERPDSERGQIVFAYCSIVREHVLSQQRLLAMECDVTAVTLVRPSFESLVRAIWILAGANDDWVRNFIAPPAPDADDRNETIMGPPVDAMLATIEKHHPGWVHRSLVALKDATWKPMHSYVHGGIRPVLQILVGYPDQHRVSLVRNGNGFLMFATNVLQIACMGVPGRIADIQRRFAGCLPPADPQR